MCSLQYLDYLEDQPKVHTCSIITIKNVKCTVVQALRLSTDCTAHRGSRGIALLFLGHGTGRDEGS